MTDAQQSMLACGRVLMCGCKQTHRSACMEGHERALMCRMMYRRACRTDALGRACQSTGAHGRAWDSMDAHECTCTGMSKHRCVHSPPKEPPRRRVCAACIRNRGRSWVKTASMLACTWVALGPLACRRRYVCACQGAWLSNWQASWLACCTGGWEGSRKGRLLCAR
eukprot:365603-Chlamydomonas_euryale.AAC.1